MSYSTNKQILSSELTETGFRKKIRVTQVTEDDQETKISVRDGLVVVSIGDPTFGARLTVSIQEAEHLANLLNAAASRLRSEGDV